ncbi:MAG: VOC family protein [Firmicutes bacterium]|nr:VOC family protein [Bacillota bacterium]
MCGLQEEAFSQIGIVVRDIERTAANYARLFNLPMPEIILTDPEEKAHTQYRGWPTKARAKLAFFPLGGITLELIEPDHEPSTWREFLETHGEGLHHLGFHVRGMDEIISGLAEMGIEVVQRGDYEGGRYAYLDAVAWLGFILEFLENY